MDREHHGVLPYAGADTDPMLSELWELVMSGLYALEAVQSYIKRGEYDAAIAAANIVREDSINKLDELAEELRKRHVSY